MINKIFLHELRRDIDKALEPIAEKYDLSIHLGNIRFSDYDFNAQLKGEVNDTGNGVSVAEKQFHEYSAHYGLEPDHFGASFKSNGKTFTISGIKPNNRKYPIIAEDERGVSYKFAARSVRLHLVGHGS